jgi:hypothetical protein
MARADRGVVAPGAGVGNAPSPDVRVLATITTGMVGVALATWGVVTLAPREMSAGAEVNASAAAHGGAVVRCIRFRGDVDPVGVRGEIRTKVGAPVDPASVITDRQLIEARLVLDGHLDAAVTAEGDVDVVFTIAAGPLYQLGAVHLVGPLAMQYPALADELPDAADGDVSARAIERTEERLLGWLEAHGLRRAIVTHRLDVDRAAKRVDVTYDAEPRPSMVSLHARAVHRR